MNKCASEELNLFAEWLVHFTASELVKEGGLWVDNLWFENSEVAKLTPKKIIDNFQGGLAYCESIVKDKWSQAPQGIARAVCQMVVYVDLCLSRDCQEYSKDAKNDFGYFVHLAAVGNVVTTILCCYGEYLTGLVSCQEMCLDDVDAPFVESMIRSIFAYRSLAMKCPIGMPTKNGPVVGAFMPLEDVVRIGRERLYQPFGYKAFRYGHPSISGGHTL